MKKASKTYRVVIDSNIWISFLIGKCLKGLQNHIDSHKLKIITCNEQLIELSVVFKRPKLKKYFDKVQISDFFELLEESSECIDILTITDLCRDPKDNYLVSIAIDGKADFLITGDKDLLDLSIVGDTTVLNYSDFNSIIG